MNLNSSFLISCVVDNHPKFQMQAWVWLCNLRDCVGPDCDLHIFHLGQPPESLQAAANHFGANISIIAPFGTGCAAFCNKLQQLDVLKHLPYDHFVLSDADIAFLLDPTDRALATLCRAKPVDRANPPNDILKLLLERANLQIEDEALDFNLEFHDANTTHNLNCNGGLYLLPRLLLQQLAEPWVRWSRFCLQQGDLLRNFTHHADQLGFLMAMLETRVPFEALPTEANFPMHFETKAYEGRHWNLPDGLHYHWKLGKNGHLKNCGHPVLDTAVTKVNERITNAQGAPGYKELLERYSDWLDQDKTK